MIQEIMRSDNNRINFILSLGIFLLFFLPSADPDLGWQIRCGQQYWQEKRICAQNEFSVLREDYVWSHSHSLYQLLIFPFWRWGGLWGLSFLNGLLIVLGFRIFLSTAGNRFWKIVFLPLIILASWPVFSLGIRSQLLSIVYFLLLLKLIELAKTQNRRLFLLTPLLIWIWANSHGGFIIGLVILGFFLLQQTIFVLRRAERPEKYIKVLLVAIVSPVLSLINPFGLKIYQEAWRHFYTIPLGNLIAEWASPPLVLQAIIILLLFASWYFIFNLRFKNSSFFYFLTITALAVLSLKAQRNIPFFFLFFSYLSALFLDRLHLIKHFLKSLAFLTTILIFSLGFLYRLPKTVLVNASWERFCLNGPVQYPCEAVKFLKTQEEGNIFNRYEWGGFLIWQLPKNKVFVDGRMPAWPTESGESPYTIYLRTLQNQPGWEKTLRDYNIKWILITPGTFMDILLKPNPGKFGWQEVFRDETAVVYKKINKP